MPHPASRRRELLEQDQEQPGVADLAVRELEHALGTEPPFLGVAALDRQDAVGDGAGRQFVLRTVIRLAFEVELDPAGADSDTSTTAPELFAVPTARKLQAGK